MTKKKIDGWLVIDKPAGVTSTDVTNRLKRLIRPRKIGHAGTLDPFATGLLLVALGEATKLVEYVMDKKKGYEFTVCWGGRSRFIRPRRQGHGDLRKNSNPRRNSGYITGISRT